MAAVYEANNVACPNVEAAIEAVEAAGHGTVVKFIEELNEPYCLPRITLRSIALWTFDGGIWKAVGIYGGYGNPLREERPS